ncbi:hypothetical protein B0T14DRAFT_342649 [Immersiella caudata]|uniref:Uncharacterized protein n=1 Tax=Immersiella caudata TaxID=314043 RepID=A0AA39W4Q7_9PEZI|nr:hypothetical protein B0T14DRAFT_342649 [Immersiella caudata]
MDGTLLPGDDAALGAVQHVFRRAKRAEELIVTSKNQASQWIQNRERQARRQKERLLAEYQALSDEATARDQARNAQLMSELCSQKMQIAQQTKELERRNNTVTREIQQLRDRMRQDATATKDRAELKEPYMQRVQEVDEDLARFKAECDAACIRYGAEIIDSYLVGRGNTPVMMAPDELSIESDAGPDGADDAIDMVEPAENANQNAAPDSGGPGRDVPRPQLSLGQGDPASAEDFDEGAVFRGDADTATAGAEKRHRTGTPTDAGNDSDQHGALGPRKRAKNNSWALPTIEYDDVYQGGNAKDKCQIFYYSPPSRSQSCIEPGWFILRCQAHNFHFGRNGAKALPSAAKHINGADHGHMRKTHANVIKTLGWRVLNCDAAKAERNNALLPQFRDPKEKMSLPEVGKPYITHDEGRAWAVMVLPLGGSFADLGVQGHFDDELSRDPPRCFERGPDGKPTLLNNMLRWADGYEDGQPRVRQRMYPVRFFNKPGSVKWVRVGELKPCNLDDPKTQKISGSLVAKTHYRELPGRREAAWSYINGRANLRDLERELPTNAPTPCIQDDDSLQMAESDSEFSIEDSSSDWEDTEEGRSLAATKSLMHAATCNHHDSQADGLPNMVDPIASTAEQPNAPRSRAPSAPAPNPIDPSQVGAGDRRQLWFSSPELADSWSIGNPSVPANTHQEISSTHQPLLSCAREPRCHGALRELHEALGLSPVDPEPVASTYQPVWAHTTSSHASAGPRTAAGHMMQQWEQPAPEADMSVAAISGPPATIAAQPNWESIRFPGRDHLGRFTSEVIEVMGPLSAGTGEAGTGLKYEG